MFPLSSRRESISFPSPASRGYLHSFALHSVFKVSSVASSNFSFALTLTLLPPSIPYKDICDYIEPIQIIQVNPGSSLSQTLYLNHIARSLLLCKATYSQGIRMQILGEGRGIILPTVHSKQLCLTSVWKFLHKYPDWRSKHTHSPDN